MTGTRLWNRYMNLAFALGLLLATSVSAEYRNGARFNPASQRWFLAGADNWDEHAWVADGDFEGKTLVFSDSRRAGGGITLTERRYTFEQTTPDALRLRIESSTDSGATSTDRGQTWTKTWLIDVERKPNE